jgi:hypothetical protein
MFVIFDDFVQSICRLYVYGNFGLWVLFLSLILVIDAVNLGLFWIFR